ncbi:hypothetical protein D3C75_1063470 [compost metagenome]
MTSGDTVYPFHPKSFAEEFAICQRYYEKSYSTDVNPGASVFEGSVQLLSSDNVNTKYVIPSVKFSVNKRIVPAITLFDGAGVSGKITTRDASDTATNGVTPSVGATNIGTTGFKVKHQGAIAGLSFQWVADAEM